MCRRSRRRGVRDRFLSLAALLPWRCGSCGARFHAHGQTALAHLALVHCHKCGNLNLEHVGRDRVVGGLWTRLQRVLRLPAYRCDNCRTRFFSMRKFRKIETTTRPEDAASASFTAEAAKPTAAEPQLDDSK